MATITGNFTGLGCNGNKLSSLEILNANELTSLSCEDNQLTDLKLDECPKLVWLLCNNNLLTNLDLSNNIDLINLYCQNNRLTDLNLNTNAAFEQFNCNNNQLSDLEISENAKLRSLYCSNNQLTNLKLHENVRLRDLYCENNRLPLSDLYLASKKTDERYIIMALDTQRLIPQEIRMNDTVDFSTESDFEGIATVFTITKNGLPTTDYDINDGIITFENTGNYIVTMKNDAIVMKRESDVYEMRHLVIIEFHVLKDSIPDTTNTTNYELRITNYELRITNYELRITNYELRTLNIEIFDAMGKKLDRCEVQGFGGEKTINIAHLTAGIYFIRINNKINKFIKN
jgi:hypothetical protein